MESLSINLNHKLININLHCAKTNKQILAVCSIKKGKRTAFIKNMLHTIRLLLEKAIDVSLTLANEDCYSLNKEYRSYFCKERIEKYRSKYSNQLQRLENGKNITAFPKLDESEQKY